MEWLKKTIKRNYYLSRLIFLLRFEIFAKIFGDKICIMLRHKFVFGKFPNLKKPSLMNEKIQWLKLNDHKEIYTLFADKYAVRKYLADKFGEQYLIPLLFMTEKWNEITPENIKEFPCIVKSNNGSATYAIIRNPKEYDWNLLRTKCKIWLKNNYYYSSQEWQYKNIKPCIIVEKLLQTKNKSIPNDYKLNFFNGKLEFVYCSVDREGGNNRNIYDANWNPLDFTWVAKDNYREDLIGEVIPKPVSFDKMVEIGKEIASNMKYVRVDFYDVDGKLYYGEITLHHGSGLDCFVPAKYDAIYGDKLIL